MTERPGRLRIVGADGISAPVSGLPPIAAGGQGGLLDVLADSAFDKTVEIYKRAGAENKIRRLAKLPAKLN